MEWRRPAVPSRLATASVGTRSGNFARPGRLPGRAQSSNSARHGRPCYGTAPVAHRQHYGSAPRLMRKSSVFAGVFQRCWHCADPRMPSWSIPGEPNTVVRSADRTGTGVGGSAAWRRRRYRPPAGRRTARGCTASRRRPEAPDIAVAGRSAGRGAMTRADGLAFLSASTKPSLRSVRCG
jgi:hypothetical protein